MFYVYMLSSKPLGTLYIGMTADLTKRIWEHKVKAVPGFTTRYKVDQLVWFEQHETIQGAIQREHNMKHWKREWKTGLVDAMNPEWDDLYPTLF